MARDVGTAAVVEAGADGSFDVADTAADAGECWLEGLAREEGRVGATDPATGPAEALRREGNAAFQRRDFEAARALYSRALAADPDDHLALGNRSAALLHLDDARAALQDAERAALLAPTWSKAFWRKAAACEALGDVAGAAESFERLAQLVPRESADGRKAAARLAALRGGDNKARAVKKGFLAQRSPGRGIYTDKHSGGADGLNADPDNQDDGRAGWRSMLRRLKEGCNSRGVNGRGENVVLDDGVFAKLLVEREFQRLVYPGIPPEQLRHAPRNLQALLEDPWYAHELVALMPRVQAKAESVLTNVKKRGAAQGEVMDAATERMLLPQVLQEAFGREVLAMVHRVNYKKHVTLANDDRTLADPTADMATWDQLDDEFLDALLGADGGGIAVLDEFLGDEWPPLLLNDVRRMAKKTPLLPAVTSADVQLNGLAKAATGRLRFIEPSDCADDFPALAELVKNLHALPFEMNRKRPARARLCAQFAHCTALNALAPGEHQPLRLDCGTGEKDNGFKLTCVYCFNGEAGAEEATDRAVVVLRAGLDAEAPVRRVSPRADRLIVFQSRNVLNEITPVPSGASELFYLTFWIHGQDLR